MPAKRQRVTRAAFQCTQLSSVVLSSNTKRPSAYIDYLFVGAGLHELHLKYRVLLQAVHACCAVYRGYTNISGLLFKAEGHSGAAWLTVASVPFASSASSSPSTCSTGAPKQVWEGWSRLWTATTVSLTEDKMRHAALPHGHNVRKHSHQKGQKHGTAFRQGMPVAAPKRRGSMLASRMLQRRFLAD